MLQFLPMIAMGLQAMSVLSAANNLKDAGKQTPAEIAQLQAMANRDRLLRAYLNPNDPLTKNLMAGESQQINSDIQSRLSNLLAANRKAALMGRQTYFNPERQDESISQYLTKESDARINQSRTNALDRILQAAQGYTGSANGYGGMVANQQMRQSANAARTPAMFGAGADLLNMFSNMGGNGGSMSNIFASLGGNGG